MTEAIQNFFARLAIDDRGLTAVEYAVLGAIVVAAIVAVGTQFQTDLAASFTKLLAKAK